jgi:hypothetical protein
MICQIAKVKTQTQPLTAINRDLIKARHIQSHIKEMATDGLAPTEGYLWGAMNAGPHLVRVTRWIE